MEPRAPGSRNAAKTTIVLAAIFISFFALTLKLEVGKHPGKGDLDVFLRAAWAAREGESLYRTTDDKGHHYLYPPLFASLSVPFADPPQDAEPESAHALPYWVSATLWYWLSVASIIMSLHVLASALEAAIGAPAPMCSKAWWALRLWPLAVFLVFAGDGLGRGQVTPFVLLLLSLSGAGILRGRRLTSGFAMGFAGVMKLFPLYLLCFPVWRRDRRMLAGAAAGLIAGILMPVAIMGPTASLAAYHEFLFNRMAGEASGGGASNVARELHGTNANIQSFEYMVYNWVNPVRSERAATPPKLYFILHIVISALVTAAALWFMRRRGDPVAEFLYFAALVELAIPILPVSRPHYYLLGAIPFTGLLAVEWRRHKGLWPGWPMGALALAIGLVSTVVAFGQRQALDYGLETYVGLALSFLALFVGRRRAGRPDSDPGKSLRLANPSRSIVQPGARGLPLLAPIGALPSVIDDRGTRPAGAGQ